jgi:peptidoglycan/LPS O-acetylase OafA/YrhL
MQRWRKTLGRQMLHATRQTETPAITAERKQLIPALTGLRYPAAFGIMYGHAVGWLNGAPADLAKTYHLASFSMTLFFVLSGFVIHYNYSDVIQQRGGIQKFFVARFARLYPLYLLVFMVELALYSQDPNPY